MQATPLFPTYTAAPQTSSLALEYIALLQRVEDWKGWDPAKLGQLLLADTLTIIAELQSPDSHRPDRDRKRTFNAYLFEHAFICCKGDQKRRPRSHSGEDSHALPPLRLKGRIWLHEMDEIRRVDEGILFDFNGTGLTRITMRFDEKMWMEQWWRCMSEQRYRARIGRGLTRESGCAVENQDRAMGKL